MRSEIKKLGQVESGVLQRHIDTLLQDLGHQQRSATYTPGEIGLWGEMGGGGTHPGDTFSTYLAQVICTLR